MTERTDDRCECSCHRADDSDSSTTWAGILICLILCATVIVMTWLVTR